LYRRAHTACSSYAMLEQHGSTRSSRLARTSKVSSPVETWRHWRDEPSGIWVI